MILFYCYFNSCIIYTGINDEQKIQNPQSFRYDKYYYWTNTDISKMDSNILVPVDKVKHYSTWLQGYLIVLT